MVYRGKPSPGCESCRARRLKCVRAKKECSGYQDPNAVRFFDQTKEVTSKARSRALAQKLDKFPPARHHSESASPPSLISVSWPNSLDDNAWSHVFTYFVGDEVNQGILAFLPELLRGGPSDGLQAIIKSLGLACVSRIHGHHEARRLSNEQYSIALRQTNKDLQDPITATADSTLAAVVLLSMYETLANLFYRRDCHASPRIAALSKAARLERIKQAKEAAHRENSRSPPSNPSPTGPWAQRSNTGSPQSMPSPASSNDGDAPSFPATCDRPAPKPAAKARHEYQPIEDFYDMVIQFNNLSIEIAAAHRRNKFHGNIAPLIDEALQLDADFGAWAMTFQAVCGYRVCRASSPISKGGTTFPTHTDEYHMYPSMRLATFWNHYRQTRMSLNEMIETMAVGMTQFMAVPQLEGVILQTITTNSRLVNDVCASVPYFFNSNPGGFGGVARLPWPLFIAAGCLHTSAYTQTWISDILDVIARCSGVHQASVMALRIRMGYYAVHGGMIPGKKSEELKLVG
ncbi:hypothetical protein N7456_000913 [Penicillium angulare]|uniref:Zn(2)-C6 fungal-type domain-containing protein n=1 Tax=Penicillium angulare TaxID=116970 RepID=A0A9W9GDC8_9EURO|nr:hypothetical protein N7456_000913 [Penicillium angulare]